MRVIVLLISVILMFVQLAFSINPYHVLQLEQGATQQKIRHQYKILRKNAKGNDVKLQLYKDAYQQIMIDSTLQMTLPKQTKKPSQRQNRRNRRRRRGLPRLSDMFRHDYFAAPKQKVPQKSPSQRTFEMQDQKNLINEQKSQPQYRLPPHLDDPSYYQTQQKVQQIIKDENVAFNIKAARFILFIGGLLLKLTPCFCLYMIYKYRKQDPREQENSDNPFTKAINGWSGKGRRIGGGKKVK